jgi:hypothetical protein
MSSKAALTGLTKAVRAIETIKIVAKQVVVSLYYSNLIVLQDTFYVL